MSESQPEEWVARINEDYLVTQVNVVRNTSNYQDHKRNIEEFDQLYRGDFSRMWSEEDSMPDEPLVENKIKNATHDIARLAKEAKGLPVFMKDSESKAAQKRAQVRTAVVDTLWEMGDGPRIERKLYLDLIGTGMAAVSVYMHEGSDYPVLMRLNPRFMYPEILNGRLLNMIHIETMKERIAAFQFPEAALDPKSKKDVFIVQYMDKEGCVAAVCSQTASGNVSRAFVTSRWQHNLGVVPVAWVALDSADDTWHGLFDQVGGPMMVRNKTVRLLVDYLEDMAHAPLDAKGILNATQEPGPLVVYQHDPNMENTHIGRVAPAAPSGGIGMLLSYMDQQESAEAIQPPARVGIVSQSIASGSFVASTQGTLSSVVKELQDVVAQIRVDTNIVAMMIDERFLNFEKPLWRAIGTKSMYTPSEDIAGWYKHRILYGAAAGLNRAEADSRVLQLMGAGLISKETGRNQIEFVDDTTVEPDRIDREQLGNVFFQRFAGDPATPLSAIAEAVKMMGEGKTFAEVAEYIAPILVKNEEQLRALQNPAPTAPAGAGQPGPNEALPAPGDATQTADQAGTSGTGTGYGVAPPTFAPPPLEQIFGGGTLQPGR